MFFPGTTIHYLSETKLKLPLKLMMRIGCIERFRLCGKNTSVHRITYYVCTIFGGEVVELLGQPGDCLGGELGGHVAVEGAGDAALLRVAEHVVAHREVAAALLRVHPPDEVDVVVRVGLLVDDHQPAEDLAVLHLADQDVHVAGEIPANNHHHPNCNVAASELEYINSPSTYLIPNFSSLM